MPWSQIREVALVARESLEAVGLVGWPKTSGSRGIHINIRIEPRWTFPEVRRAALALARDVERRAPDLATSKWWKEERHGVFLDYNQNAKDRTVASAYSVRPLPDARVSTPLSWDEVATVEAEAFTIDTVPARYAAIGDPGAGIDDAVGSLEALLELSARDEAEGLGDAPWPPNYAKQAGEPPRVQPSKARRPPSEYEPGRGQAGGPPPEVAAERAAAVAAGDSNAGLPTEWVGSKPTPTGRRKTSIPVVEIARAEFKEEALEGLERWKARHADLVQYLEPADILVDGMRGRSALWYRVRVNLIHVPEDQRPAQEPLESDFDPWAGQDIEAWKAATAGSRARRPTHQGREAEAAQVDCDDDRRATEDEDAEGRRRSKPKTADEAEAMIEVVGIDHVQLSMPPGGEDEARAFYVEILGLREIAKPPELAGRGGCWFVGAERRHPPGPGDRLPTPREGAPGTPHPGPGRAREALGAAGVPIEEDDAGLPVRRCYIRDPFGNRIELDDERDAGFSAGLSRQPPAPVAATTARVSRSVLSASA